MEEQKSCCSYRSEHLKVIVCKLLLHYDRLLIIAHLPDFTYCDVFVFFSCILSFFYLHSFVSMSVVLLLEIISKPLFFYYQNKQLST